MKILFSPSETKTSGGDGSFISSNSFIFLELYEKRLKIINKYSNFLKTASTDELSKLFGTKKEAILEKYKEDIFVSPTTKAILRYSGVAYEYLNYDSLGLSQRKYIDENLLIFSNLFGVLSAKDSIPDYKLKQGESFNDLKIEKYYQEHFSKALDKLLENEDVLDLRAGFYEKFYSIKKPYITLKFLKDGKVVSHFAKAYRGLVLRSLAQNGIKKFDDFMKLDIKNLQIQEIKEQKLKKEITFNINGI